MLIVILKNPLSVCVCVWGGGDVTEAIEVLLALPTSLAELGTPPRLHLPSTYHAVIYRQGTNVIVEAVKGFDVFDPILNLQNLHVARKHMLKPRKRPMI